MSLSNLMDCYFSVQSTENPIQTNLGSIDRSGNWVTLDNFKNIPCALQERNREAVSFQYAKLDEEGVSILYHQNEALFNYLPSDVQNQNSLRVITYQDPRQAISFPISSSVSRFILIYEFKGKLEQVQHRKLRFFVLRLCRTTKWTL